MASIDFQDYSGPRRDHLGIGLFVFHVGVSSYVLFGWIAPSFEVLTFYLLLLPAIATQWHVNQGACIINNLESWIRSGRWRDSQNAEEGAFLLMLCAWLLDVRPPPALLDRVSYATVFVLWLLGLGHFAWLTAS